MRGDGQRLRPGPVGGGLNAATHKSESTRLMNRFLFAKESPRPLTLVRIGTGIVGFLYLAYRWPFAAELYSSAGFPAPLLPGTWLEPPTLNAAATVTLCSLALFAFAAMTIGWQTRISILVALFSFGWLALLDGVGTFKKFTAIQLHLLLLLSVSGCGTYWAVDRWLDNQSQNACPIIPCWPRRLIQLLVCSIYWGAAATKLHMPGFATGELLLFSLLDVHWGGRTLGMWLATKSDLVRISSMAVVVFEIGFPLLVWVPRLRRLMIAAALVFHVILCMALYLSIFSAVMLVALLAFLDERDLKWFDSLFAAVRSRIVARRWANLSGDRSAIPLPGSRQSTTKAKVPFRRQRLVSLVAYFAVVCLWSTAGLAIQHFGGSFGLTHDRNPPAPRVISQSEIDEMLAEQLPAYEDYFHRFMVGSRYSNFQVFGETDSFGKGMTIYVLSHLGLDHPSLQMEGLLLDANGNEAATFQHRIEPSQSYSVNGFQIGQTLKPGRYQIVLKADGHQVFRRNVRVRP